MQCMIVQFIDTKRGCNTRVA